MSKTGYCIANPPWYRVWWVYEGWCRSMYVRPTEMWPLDRIMKRIESCTDAFPFDIPVDGRCMMTEQGEPVFCSPGAVTRKFTPGEDDQL